MILSDVDIEAAVAEGQLGITPWDPAMVQPAGVDLRLSHRFRLMDSGVHAIVDPAREEQGLTRRAARPYGSGPLKSHYQGQTGPTPSRSWANFDLVDTKGDRCDR